MVFTTRLAGGKGGRNQLRKRTAPPGDHPNQLHPESPHHLRQGRTLPPDPESWLTRQPPPHTIAELQTQLDAFVDDYNHRRPHRSLPHRATPATAYTPAPKQPRQPASTPTTASAPTASTKPASITLRVGGRLHHIGVGRTHDRTRVLILVQDLNIKIINAATGELLRELTLDPTRDYQPTGAPKGPTRRKPRT